MTKEKQIEEMAKDVNLTVLENCNGKCLDCEYGCMVTENYACSDFAIAKGLTAKGYRKASEVALEIFAEIEEEIKNHGITYAKRKIAELKKKYTESEDTECQTE